MNSTKIVLAGWMLLIVLLLAGPAPAGTTVLDLESQPGDYIGGGQRYTFNAASVSFSVSAEAKGISVSTGSIGSGWTIDLLPPAGGKLQDGVYEGAQRAAFHAPGVAGMEIDSPGKGCNTVSGRFELFDVQADRSGTIVSFKLQFEQHCGGAAPALFGQMLYNASGPNPTSVSVAGASLLKGNDGASDGFVVVSLSKPSHHPVTVAYGTADGTAVAGVDYVATTGTLVLGDKNTARTIGIPIIGNRTAASGRRFVVNLVSVTGAQAGAAQAQLQIVDPNGPLTVLAMTSQPGDYIGGGQAWLELDSYTTFYGSLTRNSAQVSLGEPEFWTLDFAARAGSSLSTGHYPHAQRYVFEPNRFPDLDVDGDGRGCNTLSGNFRIVALTGGASVKRHQTLSVFSAVFEQHCEEASPALFGSIAIDSVLRQLSITNAVVSNGIATFTVTVNPRGPSPVLALFKTADGTAVEGEAYQAVTAVVTIPAVSGSATVQVPLIGSHPGQVFYGTITSPDTPPVWIPLGVAHL
jgi:hypothetical protein